MGRCKTSPLAAVLVLAGVASAQMSLLNFDPLSTTQNIPITCRLAYSAPIGGCQRSDFFQGAVCSAACRAGIETMQDNIQRACGGVFAPIDTLLAQALLGNLPALLCPNEGGNAAPSTSSSRAVFPSLTTIITTPSIISTPSPPVQTETSTSQPPSEPSTTSTPAESSTSTTPTQPLVPTPTPSGGGVDNGNGGDNNNDNDDNNDQPTAQPEDDSPRTDPGGDLLSLEPSASTSLKVRWIEAAVVVAGLMSLQLM